MGKQMNKRMAAYVKQRSMLAVWAVLIVLLSEFLSRREGLETLAWPAKRFPEFLLNGLAVGCFILLIAALIGRARIAYWVAALSVSVLSLISGIKLKILGVPLLPWDFVLRGEGGDMAQYVRNVFTVKLISGVLLFLAVSLALLYLPRRHVPKRFSRKERGVCFVLSLALLAPLFFDKPVPLKSWLHVSNLTWDQSENVRTNGFVLSAVMNTQQLVIGKPDGYDKAAVAAFASQHQAKPADDHGVKPNIIVILSEAFWDPTKIPSVTFSRDPLPNFHALQQKFSSGWLLSPQYGGGTANVEFEVLTGNSMRFLPQGAIAYNQYINHEVDSLAGILARQGYVSTAISPFYNWFFNSKEVYKNFGFAKFIPIEYFNPVYEGPYIADSEVANNIMETTRRSPGPDFVFANTMENHFHFYPGKFKENTIEVQGVSGSSKGMLETLAQGLSDADKMLKTLVDHYSALDEPTIIVFFGDHLPYLGDNYEAYKATGYISGEDDPDFLNKMYRTPVLVWNNYLPERKDKLDMSPSFLGPYVLDLAKRPGTYFTDYLHELSQKYPVIPPKNYYAQMGIDAKELKRYESLQYDILFGSREGYGDLRGHIINPDYRLGYEPIVIDEAKLDTASGTLTLTGKYLPPQSIVYWDDKPLQTKWVQEGRLTARVPAELSKSSKGEVKVKIIDNKENVVGQSNIVEPSR
jgi:phosphoglycerol transferase MdoB-like AlkP superfamily enzyme